jgi:hypothetical protein
MVWGRHVIWATPEIECALIYSVWIIILSVVLIDKKRCVGYRRVTPKKQSMGLKCLLNAFFLIFFVKNSCEFLFI